MKQLFFGTVLFLFGSIAKTQVTAQDGKTYRTVKVGNQTWMAENLDVSTYRNGDSIPQVQDPKLWSSLKAGAWCYYESKNDMGVIYGKLYNWYAVIDPRGLAPEGWHIPSDAEWTQFAGFLGGRVGTSGKIKSPRGWSGGGNGTNETNFSALPGGTRSVELFSFAGNYGYWWTSSEFDSYSAWNRFLSYNNNDVGRSTGWKQFGNSVRCIKGEVENNFKPAPTEITASIPDSSKGTAAVVNPGFNPDAVSFGDQTWMKQNLDIATFKNGDRIPEVISDSAWIKAGQLKQPAWCYYNNDSTNKKLGKLYNWFAVTDKRGLAPEGWHVPNENDWTKLVNELGGERSAGGKIKSNFSASLVGFRDDDGQFRNTSVVGYWWSATESMPTTAWCHSINYYSDAFNTDNAGDKQKGFSVRCLRD